MKAETGAAGTTTPLHLWIAGAPQMGTGPRWKPGVEGDAITGGTGGSSGIFRVEQSVDIGRWIS